MKKYIAVILTVLLLLSLVGCSENLSIANNKIGSEIHSNENDVTTAKTETPVQTTKRMDVQARPVYYRFYSVSDLDTYVKTGSTDPDDYLYTYVDPFEDMLPADFIRDMGYVSLESLLPFDESDFDHVEAYFRFVDSAMEYHYLLDDVIITVTSLTGSTNETTESYYKRHYNDSSSEDMTLNQNSTASLINKYEVRKCENYDVVYTMNHGVKEDAYILIDGFFIRITSTGLFAEESELEQRYSTFMTSPKYAAFSALFSDDQETFEAAVMGMTQPKAEVE